MTVQPPRDTHARGLHRFPPGGDTMVIGLVILVTLCAGFGAGFVVRKRSCVWCTDCGAQLRCIPCTVRRHQASVAQRSTDHL